jgi:hypothetical protein
MVHKIRVTSYSRDVAKGGVVTKEEAISVPNIWIWFIPNLVLCMN